MHTKSNSGSSTNSDSLEGKNSFGAIYHNSDDRLNGQKWQEDNNENLRLRILTINPSKIPSRHRAFIRRFQMIARISRRDKKQFKLSPKQLRWLSDIEEGASK